MPVAGPPRFKNVQLNIRIPGDIAAALKRRAVAEGKTIAKVSEEMYVRYLGLDPALGHDDEAAIIEAGQVEREAAKGTEVGPDAMHVEVSESDGTHPVTISRDALEQNPGDLRQAVRTAVAERMESIQRQQLTELAERSPGCPHPDGERARHPWGSICLKCGERVS